MRFRSGKTAVRQVGRPSLRFRICLVVMAIILISVGIQIVAVRTFLRGYIEAKGGENVMSIATKTAEDPEIVAAFSAPDPAIWIQRVAERVRILTGVSFVVVFNMDTIRYSHPNPDNIGKHFVGGDEAESLKGKSYLSKATGTLGQSIRAFVPVRNSVGDQIGVVAVGQLLDDLERETRKLSAILYFVVLISLSIGLVGALYLARTIKAVIFGLEPHEIATLLEERNVIISSINEGIVAVDREGRVILLNEKAKSLLSIVEMPADTKAGDLIPGIGLDSIIDSGTRIIDEELRMNGAVVLVNRIPLSSKGEIIGAVATFRDMSEVRALAEELTEVKQYTNALRAQHHEFLNKLHVISGLLQLKRYSEAVRFTVSTMSRQQKTFDLLRRNVRTPEVAALILAKMNEAREYDIEVKLVEEGAFPAIGAEAVAPVIAILGNLLQNAIESLRGCDRSPKRICLSFDESESEFLITVHDNGDGIPPQLYGRIFERGVTSKPEGRNMGMGLYLVKASAERLGGRVETIEVEGLAFIVHLDKEQLLS